MNETTFFLICGLVLVNIMVLFHYIEKSKWSKKYFELEKRFKESNNYIMNNIKDDAFSYDLTNNKRSYNIMIFCIKDTKFNSLYLKMEISLVETLLYAINKCEDGKEFCIPVNADIGITISKSEKDVKFILESGKKTHIINRTQYYLFVDEMEKFAKEKGE